ncbi:MAG: phosphoglycerate kinase [Actinomycetota bacterium]|nr:phosphoglycerate kinase [Actinomycetota bacterium]
MSGSGVPGLDALDPAGRRILVRADFNVPLEGGKVADDLRITKTLPTIRRLREAGARVVLMSHLGRPDGEVVEELRLAPVAERLAEHLGSPVAAADDVVGDDAQTKVGDMADGDVVLLENLRFEAGEEANDDAFAEALANLGDGYVNDAFGAAHRAHASVVGVPARLDLAVAGELMRQEIEALSRLLGDPPRPFVAILGGAKVADKLGVIESLLSRVDRLLIGGAMCYTFLKARGLDVGSSRVEDDQLDTVSELMESAEDRGVELLLPSDLVVAEAFEADADHRTVAADDVPEGWMGLDIGPDTVERYSSALADAQTLVWNGPMGVFEWEPFAGGTEGVARAVADCDGYTVIGGGDSASAIRMLGLAEQVDHVSTGGGASLDFVQGVDLPGVSALRKESSS